ncbi:replication initiator protein A [Deinococcus sp. HMF7604]|uniref:replication initiator protein A n=1 Tax=Deinococcus betulae TaxID=2873312 RepID=UPI001CCB3815|nr:replication initiator protein A [Deinococcus betulae]MBZ9751730.1 replication initiator protein A [Deinococcus betulae]
MTTERRRKAKSNRLAQHLTEANVARLGLISIQERIPADFTRWEVEFEVDGRQGQLSCFSPAEYGGVPHGLDGDLANALIDLFIEQGASEDGVVTTTASQLLLRAGLHNNGHYHHVLTASLRRLKQATYTMSHAWRDHEQQRWTSGTFSYILAYEVTSTERDTVTEGAILSITLARQIVKSIRSKYVKPLDYVLLTSLERPLTRALYRLLDARRYDAQELVPSASVYQVNLLEWAAECKIVDQRTDKIRRTLEGAHTELKERGYLQDVLIEGRGRKQTLTYVFGATAVERTEDPEVVAQLVGHRVARPVARKLVATHGEAHVLARLKRFRALLASGYKARSPSAVLVDVIQDTEGKYQDPLLTGEIHTPTKSAVVAVPAVDVEKEEQQRTEAFQALPLLAQADQALSTLQLLLKNRLDTAQYAQLRDALADGRADAGQVVKAVTKAVFERRVDEAVQDIFLLIGSESS